MEQQWEKQDRRHYIRIEKHFIISYYDKNDPQVRHSISQLKNISLGGMCFVTAVKHEAKTLMGVELKTPYVADAVHVEGTVLESHEKVPNMIYETRLAFENLSEEANVILQKIIDTFLKISKEKRS